MSDVNKLRKLCRAVLSDGDVSGDEIKFLLEWFENNSDFNEPAAEDLRAVLNDAAADRKITQDERAAIRQAITKVIAVTAEKTYEASMSGEVAKRATFAAGPLTVLAMSLICGTLLLSVAAFLEWRNRDLELVEAEITDLKLVDWYFDEEGTTYFSLQVECTYSVDNKRLRNTIFYSDSLPGRVTKADLKRNYVKQVGGKEPLLYRKSAPGKIVIPPIRRGPQTVLVIAGIATCVFGCVYPLLPHWLWRGRRSATPADTSSDDDVA